MYLAWSSRILSSINHCDDFYEGDRMATDKTALHEHNIKYEKRNQVETHHLSGLRTFCYLLVADMFSCCISSATV